MSGIAVETADTLRIAERRHQLGLRQVDLARRAHCSVASIRLFEAGFTPRTSKVLERVLLVLNGDGADARESAATPPPDIDRGAPDLAVEGALNERLVAVVAENHRLANALKTLIETQHELQLWALPADMRAFTDALDAAREVLRERRQS